jgi:flagellin-like hook-associated protein FlgL
MITGEVCMTTINTNTSAILARTFAMQASDRQRTSMERLSSGLRINSSADDAAGLAVSTKMQSQLTSMNSALRNSMDGVSLIQTAMSSMSTITNIVQRMRELSVQMHNGVYTNSDRENAQLEIRQLLGSISQIAETTAFNNVLLLDGSYQNKIRAGHTNSEVIDLLIDGMGILPYIRGSSQASNLHSSTLLRSITSANGTSLLNYLASSFASGTSVLDIINQSNATGSSSFQTKATDNATGPSDIVILASNSATGPSVFNTPLLSNGGGTSQIDRLANTSGVGSSAFRIQDNSLGSGASSLIISAAEVANGVSNFNTPQNVYANPTSTQIYAATSAARVTGLSKFTTAEFQNGDFNAGDSSGSSLTSGTYTSVVGWDIYLEQINLGPNDAIASRSGFTRLEDKLIEGFAVPADTGSPTIDPIHGSLTDPNYSWHPAYNRPVIESGGTPALDADGWGDDYIVKTWDTTPTFNYTIKNGALTLGTSAIRTASFAQAHGPYITSQAPVKLEMGDTVSFDWQAGDATFGSGNTLIPNNGDSFDVYGYLLDVDTGATIELINKHSNFEGYRMKNTTGFITETVNITQNGNYKFVFISGSFDASGGTRAGGSFTIDNINVTQANPPAANETTAQVFVKAEEADVVSIDNLLMARMNEIALADPGVGTYSILPNGSDFNKFQIDGNGDITSSIPSVMQRSSNIHLTSCIRPLQVEVTLKQLP